MMETARENEELLNKSSTSKELATAADLITSFSNPNYNIEEDILNCNVTTPLLEYTNEEILNRLEGVVSLRTSVSASAVPSLVDSDVANTTRPTGHTGLLAYYRELTEAVRASQEAKEETEEKENSEEKEEGTAAANVSCSDNGGHTEGKPPSEYDLSLVKRREKKNSSSPRPASDLPAGWEKYEDEEGPYYWHVKTGTIQRAPPSTSERPMRPVSFCSSDLSSPSSSTPDLSHFASLAKLEEAFSSAGILGNESGTNLSPILSESSSTVSNDHPGAGGRFRFSVRSLGWAVMTDEELTPERSSQSVNRCIVRMAAGRRDFNESVGKWGEGQDLLLELTPTNLLLMDPVSECILHKQPIIGIKVWGVGRENNRDFAYVSRDRGSRKYHCHVFRCEHPARHLANSLCSLCKHLVLERKRKQQLKQAKVDPPPPPPPHRRPVSLPGVGTAALSSVVEGIRGERLGQAERGLAFPTPMEEPKKILKCQYIGSMPVRRPNGVELLNDAIEKVRSCHPMKDWTPVTVTVAPSTVKIVHEQTSEVLAECRVRFLSFMGISMSSVKLCGFIMHTAQNTFVAHVLHSEPTCGVLCKTIEAACTLRFQKCLDAHVRESGSNAVMRSSDTATTPNKRSSIKEGLQSMWAAMSLRKSKP